MTEDGEGTSSTDAGEEEVQCGLGTERDCVILDEFSCEPRWAQLCSQQNLNILEIDQFCSDNLNRINNTSHDDMDLTQMDVKELDKLSSECLKRRFCLGEERTVEEAQEEESDAVSIDFEKFMEGMKIIFPSLFSIFNNFVANFGYLPIALPGLVLFLQIVNTALKRCYENWSAGAVVCCTCYRNTTLVILIFLVAIAFLSFPALALFMPSEIMYFLAVQTSTIILLVKLLGMFVNGPEMKKFSTKITEYESVFESSLQTVFVIFGECIFFLSK